MEVNPDTSIKSKTKGRKGSQNKAVKVKPITRKELAARKVEAECNNLPIIFQTRDLLLYVISYLSYPDICALRCCRKLFQLLPLTDYFKDKTKYLQAMGIQPIVVAKLYKNTPYLLWLQKVNHLPESKRVELEIAEEKGLHASLLKCDHIPTVKALYLKWSQVMYRLHYKIGGRLLANELTKDNISEFILKTYGVRYKGEILEKALQADDLELYQIIVRYLGHCEPNSICEYKAARIFTHYLTHVSPVDISVRHYGWCDELRTIATSLNYRLSYTVGEYEIWSKC